jgi:ubiquinone/menaquinone biosynthesis C-methylase UbiE
VVKFVGMKTHDFDLEKDSVAQFNIWSQDYDQKRFWVFYFSNRAVLQSINPQKGTAILDVGCGTGILLRQLLRLDRSLSLSGVDIAAGMVKMAQMKLGKSVKIQRGSANNLPYRENSFDFVTCATSFHHYARPDNSLREMWRVLKPEGKLVVLDPFINGTLRKAFCAILDTLYAEKGTHLFTREQMYQMFHEAGFNQIAQKPYGGYKLLTMGVKAQENASL